MSGSEGAGPPVMRPDGGVAGWTRGVERRARRRITKT